MPRSTSTAVESTITGDQIDLLNYFNEDPWEDYKEVPEYDNSPLPEGKYNARVKTVEGPMLNKAETAYMLKFTYVIEDEPYVGRHVWQYVSLQPSAKHTFQNTFTALGKLPNSTDYTPGEFDGMPCQLRLTVRPARGGYPPSNDVRRVFPAADESSTTENRW